MEESYPQSATCLPQAGESFEILSFGPPRSTQKGAELKSLPAYRQAGALYPPMDNSNDNEIEVCTFKMKI